MTRRGVSRQEWRRRRHPSDGSDADGNFAIVLADTLAGSLTPLTATSACTNNRPSINADGTRIAFTSSCNLVDNGNADGNQEIFLFDTTASAFRQITSSSRCFSDTASLNAAGTLVAFVSTCDLTGENGDGNEEGFVFNTAGSVLTQFTNSSGACHNEHPSIDSDGKRLAFVSSCNLLGNDADGNEEIFLAVEATLRATPALSVSSLLGVAVVLLAAGWRRLRRRTATPAAD